MNLSKNQIVIVTGLSGAGRTTALKIFEDFGYEAVDNLPCSILGTLINKGVKNKIAIGIDIRSRDFNGKTISKFIAKNKDFLNINIIYFDCKTDVLIDRFKESRRRHPLKLDIPISEIIEQERIWLEPLKKISDLSIDTTNLSIRNLNKMIESYYSSEGVFKLNLRILSFGYKYGIPRESDIVLDMRFIRNPFYEEELKNLDGRNNKVIQYIEDQESYKVFFKSFTSLFVDTLPMFFEEGKKYLTIAFGCTGGIHRSVMVAEKFYKEMNRKKMDVFLDHRDLKK